MITTNSFIEVKNSFRYKIDRKLSKHGRKVRAAHEMGITRKALWHFLKGEAVKMQTLNAIVKKFEGENANVEDYIKPL